jgi:hypothetical protein
MSDLENSRSRNPNLCASCSSLADGREDEEVPSAIKEPAPIAAEIMPRSNTLSGNEF